MGPDGGWRKVFQKSRLTGAQSGPPPHFLRIQVAKQPKVIVNKILPFVNYPSFSAGLVQPPH